MSSTIQSLDTTPNAGMFSGNLGDDTANAATMSAMYQMQTQQNIAYMNAQMQLQISNNQSEVAVHLSDNQLESTREKSEAQKFQMLMWQQVQMQQCNASLQIACKQAEVSLMAQEDRHLEAMARLKNDARELQVRAMEVTQAKAEDAQKVWGLWS